MKKIEDIAALEALYATPQGAAVDKVADRLTPLYRAWIEGSRFCILSTVGAQGVHGTPRGDDGPVVRVHDETRLLMPDWRGNNRLEALRDIVGDGRVALLFLVPGSGTTVRVNGKAWLTDDPALCQSFEQRGKHPTTVIVIEMDEVYTQCAKALLRSGLWQRDDRDSVPNSGDILKELTGVVDPDRPATDAEYAAYALPRMW